jgi:hypothetical protein
MEQIQRAKQVIATELSWLQRHERIIIAAFVLALGIWGFNKWVDVSARNADAAASVAKTAQVQADAQQKQYQDFIAKQTALYEQDRAASDAKILTLMNTIANRDNKAAGKIAGVTNPNNTPIQVITDLNEAYQGKLNLDPTPITSDGRLVFSPFTVEQFTATKIQSDTCSADLTDMKTSLTTSESETASAQVMVADLQGQVKQDDVTLKAHDDAAAAEVKKVKADARKSKWHIFWWGYGAGFASRQAIKHFLGI